MQDDERTVIPNWINRHADERFHSDAMLKLETKSCHALVTSRNSRLLLY